MRKALRPVLWSLGRKEEARGMPPVLPELPDLPTQHRDCCASLSSKLFKSLAKFLPRGNAIVLSIGSGTGLLEALLQQRQPHLTMEGVEVSDSVNKYLPRGSVHVVAGSWDTSSRAAEASSWLFVYPRKPALVSYYFENYGNYSVRVVIWIGPKADWQDFSVPFQKAGFKDFLEVHDSGLASYETMMAITKPADGTRPAALESRPTYTAFPED